MCKPYKLDHSCDTKTGGDMNFTAVQSAPEGGMGTI